MAVRITGGALALALMLVATVVGAASPPRPTEDRGSNFYLLAGIEAMDLDLDPRGSDEFVEAGLVPRTEEPALIVGVGWVFRHPLRLDLTAGGWRAELDRPGANCTVARAAADLHLAVIAGAVGSLEATFSAAFMILNYDGSTGEEYVPGSSVGVGATGRLKLFGPLGLGASYQYQLGRYQPTTFQFDDGEPFRVHPTSRAHGVRATIYVDL